MNVNVGFKVSSDLSKIQFPCDILCLLTNIDADFFRVGVFQVSSNDFPCCLKPIT